MLPGRAEQMLKDYKNHVGRAGFLRKAIAEAEADIIQWKSRLAEDLATNGGINLDGMPRGTTVGNPTERMALMLATGYMPEDLREAERQLEEMREELRKKEMILVFVDAWLNGLTSKERWLIEQIYFEGCTYNETARAYADKYGIQMNRDSIRRMKKTAVRKIEEMAV